MMNRTMLLIITIFLFSCGNMTEEVSVALIPFPDTIINHHSFSEIEKLNYGDEFPFLNEMLRMYAGDPNEFLPVSINSERPNVILDEDPALISGAYKLNIQKNAISITFSNKEGVRNAISTLQQLYFLNNKKLPLVDIDDAPRFSYRGMHLDVGRHFFGVEDIKKYIDFLAFYKYNYFHWHLTEDQGWRIEIKKYPKLQEIAAYREETLVGHYNDQPHQFDGKKYGGYYSQEDIKLIVQYATSRGIEIIPEIEMPGHALAAIAAYPQLGCEDKDYKVGTKWGVYDDVYCPTETTFNFLQDVLDEVMTLFPSEYIHIGGDECPKTAWKKSKFCQDLISKEGLKDEYGLQSYFIQRIEKYLNSKGKKIIGWDEIHEGGLAPNATVMSWRGIEGGIEAANENHNVIMTPTSHCYLDYYQSNHPDEPLAIGGYLPIDKVYNYEPIPEELPADKHKYILGAQGNIWTEYIRTYDYLEYMAYARSMALSEVVWRDKEDKDFADFKERFLEHDEIWKSRNVTIANHFLDLDAYVNVIPGEGAVVHFDGLHPEAKINYRANSADDWQEMKDNKFPLTESGNYNFQGTRDGNVGRISEIKFVNHLGTNAAIELVDEPSGKYSGKGSASVINGVVGTSEKYGGNEWLGFEGKDFSATIDFGEMQPINEIKLRFFKGEGQWIYLPSTIELHAVDDSGTEKLIFSKEGIESDSKIAIADIVLDGSSYKSLKVLAKNYGTIPDGRQGSGHKAWLFVDEIIIQ